MRRLMRFVSSVAIVLGLLVLADAALTLVWQEPVTAVIAMIKRDQIDKRFLGDGSARLPRADRRALHSLDESQRIAYLARREQHELVTGDALGRIMIPRIRASFLVVQGTDEGSLEKGPGHYAMTALPGLGQTVAIAGHRTTYLAPFRHIDALAPGDRIVLRMPYGRFVYAVQYHRIAAPTAWWITGNMGYDRLILSACDPLYSAAHRIVVFARLAHLTPSTG